MAQIMTGLSVNVSGSGDFTLLAGVPGKIIKVWRVLLTCNKTGSAPVQIQFKSGTTAQPGPVDLFDGGAVVLGLERRRWVATAVGEALVMNLSTTATIKGALTVEVTDP